MKMTICTVVVNWRYRCASPPNSPSALRFASAAAAPDVLRGSLAFAENQLPLCPMVRPGLRVRSPPARAAEGRAGAGGALESRGGRRVPSRLHIVGPAAGEAGCEGGEAAPHARPLLGPCQLPHWGARGEPPGRSRPAGVSAAEPTPQTRTHRRGRGTVPRGALRSRRPLSPRRNRTSLSGPRGRTVSPSHPPLAERTAWPKLFASPAAFEAGNRVVGAQRGPREPVSAHGLCGCSLHSLAPCCGLSARAPRAEGSDFPPAGTPSAGPVGRFACTRSATPVSDPPATPPPLRRSLVTSPGLGRMPLVGL